jgi:hypothetical protein
MFVYNVFMPVTTALLAREKSDDFTGSHITSLQARCNDSYRPAFQSAIEMLQIQSTSTSLLRLARRMLPDGTPDPTDRSQQQPDLAIYDYHRGGAHPTLVDVVVTDPTAP